MTTFSTLRYGSCDDDDDYNDDDDKNDYCKISKIYICV